MQVGQKKRQRVKWMMAKRRLNKGEEAEHPLRVLDTSSLPEPRSGAGGATGRCLGSSAH